MIRKLRYAWYPGGIEENQENRKSVSGPRIEPRDHLNTNQACQQFHFFFRGGFDVEGVGAVTRVERCSMYFETRSDITCVNVHLLHKQGCCLHSLSAIQGMINYSLCLIKCRPTQY
jgi:hypothetical protein